MFEVFGWALLARRSYSRCSEMLSLAGILLSLQSMWQVNNKIFFYVEFSIPWIWIQSDCWSFGIGHFLVLNICWAAQIGYLATYCLLTVLRNIIVPSFWDVCNILYHLPSNVNSTLLLRSKIKIAWPLSIVLIDNVMLAGAEHLNLWF